MGETFFFFFVFGAPGLPGALQGSLLHTVRELCEGQTVAFFHFSVGLISVTLESSHEESSSQLQMGGEAIYCGLWYVYSGSYHLSFFIVLTIMVVDPK